MNSSQRAIRPIFPRPLETKQQASWPTFFIILLLIFAAFFPAALLSIINVFFLTIIVIKKLMSRKNFSLNINLARVIIPFILIALFGLASGIGSDNYLYFKDVWYVLNPILVLSVGYFLYRSRPDLARGMRAFIYGGAVIALFHIIPFAIHSELLLQAAARIREVAGTGYYAPVLALTILIAYYGKWREGLKLSSGLLLFCSILCTLSVVFSFSRTIMIVMIIGIISSLSLFARHALRWIFSIALLGLLSISILNFIVNDATRDLQNTFIGKLARSMEELKIKDFNDFASINENWRGYETARALKLYYSGSSIQLLLGHGFGTQVDLGISISLGGVAGEEVAPVQFIPILHNGYAYLLVKGGAVAVVLYCYTLFFLYRVGRRKVVMEASRIDSASGQVMQAISVSLAVTTWIIAGVFNKSDMFPLLLAAGYLLAAISGSELNNRSKRLI